MPTSPVVAAQSLPQPTAYPAKKQKKYAPEARIPTSEFVQREMRMSGALAPSQYQRRDTGEGGGPVNRTVGAVTSGVQDTLGQTVGGVGRTVGDTTAAVGRGDVLGAVGGATGGLGKTVGGVGRGLVSSSCVLRPPQVFVHLALSWLLAGGVLFVLVV